MAYKIRLFPHSIHCLGAKLSSYATLVFLSSSVSYVILERKFEECSKNCLAFRQEWEEAEKLSGASIACTNLVLPTSPFACIVVVSIICDW